MMPWLVVVRDGMVRGGAGKFEVDATGWERVLMHVIKRCVKAS